MKLKIIEKLITITRKLILKLDEIEYYLIKYKYKIKNK